MPLYRLAGREVFLAEAAPELEFFQTDAETQGWRTPSLRGAELVSRARGWVAEAEREVETYRAKEGFLLKAQGCGACFVSSDGDFISPAPSQLGLTGIALVFALALQNVWCLHCGAALRKESLFAFAGESGAGKSTLSARLREQGGWRRVADDLLPVKMEERLLAFPRFPQLKLKAEKQPARNLPERLPLNVVCELERAASDSEPRLIEMSAAETAQVFLRHTAGTRMFGAELLARHLQFSAQAATQVVGYKLMYPHRREALPQVEKLLQTLC